MMQSDGERGRVIGTIRRYHSFRYALILEGIFVGGIVGLVIVGFRLMLEQADTLRNMALEFGRTHAWFIGVWFLLLAVAAVIVALLLKWESFISGSGIPQVEAEILGQIDQKWWRVLFAKAVAGVLSLGFGLSLGREGPSIQLGSMAAKGFSRLTKRVKTEEKLLMTCGASAGLAAAFNAPIAGVLFSLEEVHKHFSPEVLLPCMAASVTADFVSKNVFGLKPVFAFSVSEMIPLGQYGHAIILGLIIGLLGVAYNTCLSKTQDLYEKIPRAELRLLLPFMLAGIFGLCYPAVLGGGHYLVEEISTGQMMLWTLCSLFVIKFCFSMASFGSGAPGGIFLPLLVMGAVIGAIYFNIMNGLTGSMDGLLGNFIILGMAGYFAAIVRAPITGVILISEMTGSLSHLLTLSIASLGAYIIPDILSCAPVYEQLLHRMMKKIKGADKMEIFGGKVLVEGMIYHGSPAEGLSIAEIAWPKTCLVVSLQRWEAEFVPRGDTRLMAGDKLVLLCSESMESQVHQILQEFCETVSNRQKEKEN